MATSIIGPSYAALTAMAQRSAFGFSNQTVVDKAPPEIHHMIDPYWYQFPPMNELWYGILGFVIFCLGCVSIIGNGLVVYIFLGTKALRTPSNLLVVNLAFSDFGMMFTMSPPMVINCYYETWIFGPLMCEVYALCGSAKMSRDPEQTLGTLAFGSGVNLGLLWANSFWTPSGSIFGCASIWSLCMISFDRYNVIVKGLSAKPMTTGGALLRILFIWSFCSIWTFAPMFGWNRYVPEGNLTACGTDYLSKDWTSRSYIVAYSMFVWLIPLLTIIYSYWFILKAVSEHERNMREQAKKMNVASLKQGSGDAQSVENKLAKVALTTVSLWFLAWTPYLVINWAGIFELARLTPLFTIWGSVFAKANSVYNPIVYALSHPKYRQALFAKFPSLACVGEPMPASDAQSTTSGVTTLTDKEANA